jgi:hypothetical protein
MSFCGPQSLLGRKQRQKCLPITFRNAHISGLPLGTKGLVLTLALIGHCPGQRPPQIHLAGGRMLQNSAGKIRALANVAVNVDQYSARCGSILELQSPESPAEVAGQ